MTFLQRSQIGGRPSIGVVASAMDRIGNFLSSTAERSRQYKTFVRTFEGLNVRSESELDAMGIDRTMIAQIAMETACARRMA